jgi:hypothetical protein
MRQDETEYAIFVCLPIFLFSRGLFCPGYEVRDFLSGFLAPVQKRRAVPQQVEALFVFAILFRVRVAPLPVKAQVASLLEPKVRRIAVAQGLTVVCFGMARMGNFVLDPRRRLHCDAGPAEAIRRPHALQLLSVCCDRSFPPLDRLLPYLFVGKWIVLRWTGRNL